jgi:hypothetical protein
MTKHIGYRQTRSEFKPIYDVVSSHHSYGALKLSVPWLN